MSQIIYSEPELIIGLNRKVISVNPNDLQIFKEIELPEDLTKCGFDLKAANTTTTTTNGEPQESAKNNTETPSIHHVQISPNHQLLAITTSGQKAVLLYQLRMEHAKLVSVRSLARNSSALAFNKDSTLLLVTDKSGDCYAYDCVDLQAPPKLILGHLSIVFDILWSADENYIITCDRDDKIRVTNYPRTYDIHSYCLGHREFVSAIRLLKQDFIVSVSGDRTMRLWNYSSGEQLASSELEAPGLRLALRSVDENLYHAAVLLHQPKDGVALYQISDVAGQWEITHIATYSFPDFKAQTICFADQRLYVSGVENDHFTLKLVPIEGSSEAPKNWLAMIDEQFAKETVTLEDFSAWYKKKYDNVTDYMERKKRRIEQKEKKTKSELDSMS